MDTSTGGLELFFCYAHEDKFLRDELDLHLANLKRQRLITSWYDGEIYAGMEWEREIAIHLRSADIVLLLVSASFLSSDYCYSVEMRNALERHEASTARVIPIIVRAVHWEGAPFSKLHVLPSEAKPVTSWLNRDEAWLDTVKGIAAAVKYLQTSLKEASRKEQREIGKAEGTKVIDSGTGSEKLDLPTGRLVDGIDDFAATINSVPEYLHPLFRDICAWAIALEKACPLQLQTYHGKTGNVTLLPRLRGEGSGLVSIYNRGGKVALQFWRSVFERHAPESLVYIEQHFTPVRKGNLLYEITPELLNVLTAAYQEARKPKI